MSEKNIEKALKRATDTKACVIGEGVTADVPALFRDNFPCADSAVVVCDPRTRKAAGGRLDDFAERSFAEKGGWAVGPQSVDKAATPVNLEEREG